MADTFFIEGLNTLPEQVQLNKEDIKTNTTNIATNTADITKLKDDISKINPNAWEERKINFDVGEGTPTEFTTYNPITDINAPVNIQKVFTDKDTYTPTDVINSYSFVVSSTNLFAYVVCADPSMTLNELIINDLTNTLKNAIILQGSTTNGKTTYDLNINCKNVKTKYLQFSNASNNRVSWIEKDHNSSNEEVILTGSAINRNFLTQYNASRTYATINALKPLQNSYFEADLTPAGLAKIQANATIGTSITLDKDTDFIENITNTDLSHRTVIFTLYRDDDEEVYISKNIKLDIANTTHYYSDNDRPHIWFTGLGVIKLGSASAPDNNYLCYIAYDTTSTRGLMITPVQKLN